MNRNYLFRSIFVVLALFVHVSLYATHNRAGEISVRQVDCPGLVLEAIVITYTKTTSPVDRDSLFIEWGDGSGEWVARENGNPGGADGVPQGEVVGNGIKRNVYRQTHTFPGRGTYVISMTDPNRNGGILNLNPPNSDAIEFHIETTYTFLDPQFDGCNNTPILLQPPIDVGCIGQPFTHNPGAYDLEGDSLSYEIVQPLAGPDMVAPNYLLPNFCCGNAGSTFTMDAVTGDLVWDSPQRAGEYNFAFIIVSWRNGFPIDTVLRDVQVTIEECDDNQAPVIETVDEICVVAGELIEFNVRAFDPDTDDLIQLTAIGGPYAVVAPTADSSFNNTDYLPQPINRTFRWQTSCDHIALNPYTVVFRAVDDYGDEGLATLKSVRITVVGPPPEDVEVVSGTGQIEVFWENPYTCENAADDYFLGFSVWRRTGSNQFPPDSCTPGLDGRGYTRVRALTLEENNGRYYYLDTDVERGRTYCYRILALFARYSNVIPPQPFNIVESLPSEEACVQLNRDLPLIREASVLQTDANNGELSVVWTKPIVEDLDTLVNPGPYRYVLQRATGQGAAAGTFQDVPGAQFDYNSFAEANDTSFIDTGLNTVDNSYTYQVAFFVNNGEELGDPVPASSEYLTISPADERNILTWTSDVPWRTDSFAVFRQHNTTGVYDSIDIVYERTYTDDGLVNGREYCYYIKAYGSYGIDGILDPLINLSQETCQAPEDNEAPCPPPLVVTNLCDQPVDCAENVLENTLQWQDPVVECPESDDVVGYRIYYSPTVDSDLEQIAEIDDHTIFEYVHAPDGGIAGCYAITAVDSFDNESLFSEIVCKDNCPIYELPNTFTPNGDGSNDTFYPRASCFISRVEFQVYNRWGNLVFETIDPQLNWDGKSMDGEDLAEATYYYKCIVFEQRVSGIERAATELSGYIELLR